VSLRSPARAPGASIGMHPVSILNSLEIKAISLLPGTVAARGPQPILLKRGLDRASSRVWGLGYIDGAIWAVDACAKISSQEVRRGGFGGEGTVGPH
jgi:hypothetical protein